MQRCRFEPKVTLLVLLKLRLQVDQEYFSPMATDQAYPPVPSLDAAAFADAQASISAYYSLVFPNFTYFLQTLNVTIGRRCSPTAAESSSSSAEKTQVDVDLGPLKSVSRLHAKIEYEDEEERFVLVVVGRNGAWVDGVWSGSGSRVPLSERWLLIVYFCAAK
jgi:FHA domain